MIKKPVFTAYDDASIECSMEPRQALMMLRSICDDILSKLITQEVERQQRTTQAIGMVKP